MPRTFDHIDWHLQVRAENKQQLEKVLEHFKNRAGTRTRVISTEEMWRVKNLQDVKLASPLNVEDPAQAIFRMLLMIKEVATGWQIKGPIAYEDGMWLFGALASAPQARFHVNGLEWANVELRNFSMFKRDVT